MYSEEMDWCHRIKDAGWEVVYLPTATVIHHEGKSSEQVVPRGTSTFRAARCATFASTTAASRASWCAPFSWRPTCSKWTREGLKWLVGHKRPLRAERMRAYWPGAALRD